MENFRPRSPKLDRVLLSNDCPTRPPNPAVSLPLHELNNQSEAPGRMSVLEWRRAVWFEVQLINHSSSLDQNSSDQKSQRPCQRSHSWMMKDTSSNSDSVDELTDRPNISRPYRLSSHQPSKKPPMMPLIDLSQPTDADGRPIQYENGRPKLVSQTNKPNKRVMAAPDIEQRHREAIRRLQAEATEQLIYAEWEATHERKTPHFDLPKLHRLPSRRAPLQKLSDFARRSVSNLSVRTAAVESPPRTVTSAANTNAMDEAGSKMPKTPENRNGSTRFTRMIKKFGSIRRPSERQKLFCPHSEASMSRKSLLSSFRFSASTSAFHS